MIGFRVNGRDVALDVGGLRRLLDVLREDLGLTGTKEGCGEGECGSCTVLLDGDAVCACLVPVGQAAGAEVVTVEGTGHEHLQAAFAANGAAQCGICTPGMLLAARGWLARCARDGTIPDVAGARAALAGNLCRCTGYDGIVKAVLSVASSGDA